MNIMLAWILIIFIGICVLGFLISVFAAVITRDIERLILGLPCVLFSVIPIMIMGIAVTGHVNDIATIRQGESFIQIRQEAIDDIEESLKIINAPQTALMNMDSPVAALVKTKSDYIKDLTEIKLEIQEAKRDIEARKLGLMSGVVTIYGDQ